MNFAFRLLGKALAEWAGLPVGTLPFRFACLQVWMWVTNVKGGGAFLFPFPLQLRIEKK